MLRRLLALDGVVVVCRFRDDGAFVDGMGLLDEAGLRRLARFAHDYKRMVQGNADQLAMFADVRGWTPPGGWIVRGARMSVCSAANLVCLVANGEGNLAEVMRVLTDAAHW